MIQGFQVHGHPEEIILRNWSLVTLPESLPVALIISSMSEPEWLIPILCITWQKNYNTNPDQTAIENLHSTFLDN